MKKRFLALVCAMTMVCAMGLSVAAEESVTSDAVKDAVQEAAPATNKIQVNDDVVTVTVDGVVTTLPVSAENRAASAAKANQLISSEVTVTEATGSDIAAIAEIAVAVAKKASDAQSVETLFLANLDGQNGMTIKLDVQLADNQTAYALHYVNDEVEVIPCVVDGDGISFTAPSFSIYSVIVVTGEGANDDAADEEEEEAETPAVEATSPKTGSVAAVVAMLALVSGCGAAVLGKKKEN